MTAEEQTTVLRALQKASGRVENVLRYITPKGGITLAYATSDAHDEKGIAIVSEKSVGFGIDEPISRIILTVRRYNLDIRAAGIIKLNDDIKETVKELFIDVAEYNAAKYPKGIATMDWGMNFVCRNRNARGDKKDDAEEGVPAAVCVENASDTGGCIYIFAETPDEVANRIFIISERLIL